MYKTLLITRYCVKFTKQKNAEFDIFKAENSGSYCTPFWVQAGGPRSQCLTFTASPPPADYFYLLYSKVGGDTYLILFWQHCNNSLKYVNEPLWV